MRVVDADPCACVAAAVPELVATALYELDLGVLLSQVGGLDVHRKVDGFGVSRAEKLSIGCRVHEQELPREDPISALQQVVVVALLALHKLHFKIWLVLLRCENFSPLWK